MAFIKRIGTEEVQFNVEIHLQKLSLNLNTPDCLVHVLFQRGERKVQTLQPALLQNKIAFLSETLELPITFYHDRKKKVYQEKYGSLFILLQGARGIKKAGEIHIDFSQYLNQDLITKNQVLHIEKCPDVDASLLVKIVLVQHNTQIEQPSKTEKSKSSILNNGHSQIDLSPKNASGKFLFHKDKKLDANEPLKRKPDVSLKLIDISSISPIQSMAPIDKQYTEEEIHSHNEVLETREELKYLRIEMGQLKNLMMKIKDENIELIENLESATAQKNTIEQQRNKLEGLLNESKKQNEILKLKITVLQSDPEVISDQPTSTYGSNNIELQQLMLDNKKLQDSVRRIQKEKDLLEEQISISNNASRKSTMNLSEEGVLKLQQKINELEQRLQNDPNAQENKISRLAIENEQTKRKMQDQSERHAIELSRLTDKNEDQIEESIKSYREQVETLSNYKNKYDNMIVQFRKNQTDQENLTSLKFDLEDMINKKEYRIQQLENELTKVKQSIAGAMTEFLNYGDTNSIDIMEYYMT